MPNIVTVQGISWNGSDVTVPHRELLHGLEGGDVLFFPNLGFGLDDAERGLLDPVHADPKRKNISLEPDGTTLRGVVGDETLTATARGLLARFQHNARQLVDGLLEPYREHLRAAPASLRLHRVETRLTSWRKDDSRLHVDAFPSRPLAGQRILRVFTNIHPGGVPRVWRVGESFDEVVDRFLPTIRPPLPGSATVLKALKITKQYRTRYDHYMLKLHDAMKADMAYQRDCRQQTIPFPPGSVWVCYSDQATHAVMSGQFMMEQTYFLPPEAMVFPAQSPQQVLERATGAAVV